MRFKVNLFSRGLILVLLPIFGQLIFIVVISSMMQQAQADLEKQWRGENLLRSTFSLCREFTNYLSLCPTATDVSRQDWFGCEHIFCYACTKG